ncbi:hypothetical protein HN51_005983 [Arachis hypogaea]
MLQKRKHEGEERGRKKEKRVATKVAMTDKETRSREKRRQKCILQVRQHLSASSISCNWKLSSSGYGECWFRTDKRKEKPVEDENKIKCKMKTMNCKFWRKLILVLLIIHMLKDEIHLTYASMSESELNMIYSYPTLGLVGSVSRGRSVPTPKADLLRLGKDCYDVLRGE